MAADPRFDDSARWEVVSAVNVFDEHQDRRGNKVVRKFTRNDLAEIAERCNKRDAKGQHCPLTLGHTRDDADEKEQPEIVGYARNFRVAYDEKLGRHVIRADYYLRRDRASEAREYPRISVEYWPDGRFFDPIALLRRTPQRDLGQWTYHRRGPQLVACVRYAMGDKPMADEREDEREEKSPVEPPDKDAPPPPADEREDEEERREDEPPPRGDDSEVEPEFHAKVMKCIRGHYKHLDRMHEDFAKKYEMGSSSQGNTFVPGQSDDDPNAPPPTGKSDDSESDSEAPPMPSKSDDKKPDQMARADIVVKMAAMEKRMKEMEQENKQARHAKAEADRLDVLVRMRELGYDIDPQRVLKMCRRFSDNEFADQIELIREMGRKDPSKGPPLPVSPLSQTARYAAEKTFEDDSPDELTENDMDRFHDYLRQNQGASYEAAKKYAMDNRPKRFALSRGR